jgi:hypothetical protein
MLCRRWGSCRIPGGVTHRQKDVVRAALEARREVITGAAAVPSPTVHRPQAPPAGRTVTGRETAPGCPAVRGCLKSLSVGKSLVAGW